MRPEDVGWSSESIVLSKHSGRHALVARAKALGYPLDGAALDDAFAAFKALADEVGVVDDARFAALLREHGSAGMRP
jgi:2-isopropylmalate synthase